MILTPHPEASVGDARTGESWTPAMLARRIACRAAVLAGRGLTRGGRVTIAHGGTPAFVADLFAVWRLGGVAVCVNPHLTAPEREILTAFVRPTAVLDGSEPQGTSGVAVPAVETAPGDPALVLFTSGTTGDPKGVVLSHGAIAARARLNREHIAPGALARALCVLPTHFGHGLIGNLLTPLLAGGEVMMLCEPSLAEIGGLGALIDKRGVSFLSSVPAFWRLALRTARPPAGGTLMQVNVGSAPLSADLWRRVATWCGTANVVNTYGITEAANWIAGASAAEHEPEDGLVGRAWGGEIALRDSRGRRRECGEGEVVVRSAALMSGYLERADLTAAAFADGWYRTGDVGRIGEDGLLRLTGRLKEEINRAGAKVQPAEIDLLLERHPDVVQACCFGVPDAVGGESVAVAVVGRAGAELDANALRAWCAARIRRECVPEKWFFPAGLPVSARGKVNRDAVRRHCLSGDAAQGGSQ